jgi:hypothetical protein
LTVLHKPEALPTLTLAGLRETVRAGDPGCLCDPELFTGPAGIEEEDEAAEVREARVAVAREVCAACPVRLPCLAYALRTRPAAGVWAGCTAGEITDLAAAAVRPARPNGRHVPLRSGPWLGKTSGPSAMPGEVA